jgi:hypothetical protein
MKKLQFPTVAPPSGRGTQAIHRCHRLKDHGGDGDAAADGKGTCLVPLNANQDSGHLLGDTAQSLLQSSDTSAAVRSPSFHQTLEEERIMPLAGGEVKEVVAGAVHLRARESIESSAPRGRCEQSRVDARDLRRRHHHLQCRREVPPRSSSTPHPSSITGSGELEEGRAPPEVLAATEGLPQDTVCYGRDQHLPLLLLHRACRRAHFLGTIRGEKQSQPPGSSEISAGGKGDEGRGTAGARGPTAEGRREVGPCSASSLLPPSRGPLRGRELRPPRLGRR